MRRLRWRQVSKALEALAAAAAKAFPEAAAAASAAQDERRRAIWRSLGRFFLNQGCPARFATDIRWVGDATNIRFSRSCEQEKGGTETLMRIEQSSRIGAAGTSNACCDGARATALFF